MTRLLLVAAALVVALAAAGVRICGRDAISCRAGTV